MALSNFPLAVRGMMSSALPCMVDPPGDTSVAVTMMSLLLNKKLIQKFLNPCAHWP